MFTKGVNDIYIFVIALKNIVLKLVSRLFDLFIANMNSSVDNKSDRFQTVNTPDTEKPSTTPSSTNSIEKSPYEKILDIFDTLKKPELKDKTAEVIGEKADIGETVFSYNIDSYSNFSIDTPELPSHNVSLNELHLTQKFIDKNKPYQKEDRCWDKLSYINRPWF